MSIERDIERIVRLAVRDEMIAAGVERPPAWRLAYSVTETAHMLGVGQDTVRRLVREGKLRTMDLGPGNSRVTISLISIFELDRGLDVARFFRLIESDEEFEESNDGVQRRRAS